MTQLIKYKNLNPIHARSILSAFFGPAFASRITINDKVVEVIWKMISNSKKCTELVQLVPRPTGGIPGASYIVMQLGKLGYRLISSKDEEISNICKSGVAYNYSTLIQIASSGL